jgi:hypothetical protein
LYFPTYNDVDVDVNGRYMHSHSLLEELKPVISKLTHHIPSSDGENLNSAISIIRITSPPQSTISLSQTLTTLLSRITGAETRSFRGGISVDMPRPMETTMKSARGVEYSKPGSKIVRKENVKVSMENPGLEFNRRVSPLPPNPLT